MKTNTSNNGGLTDLILKALLDENFRELLLTEHTKAIDGFNLSESDIVAVKNLDRKMLETGASQVQVKAEWYIGIGISGHFAVDSKKNS